MSAPLGHPRLHLRRTDSTNERARALALAGAPHGTLVSAAEQTAGRGRAGAALERAGGQRAAVSHCCCWSISPPRCCRSLAAVAVCDVAGAEARVKWPNDVVVARGDSLAKLAGILIEGRPQEGWAVLGVGLNVAVRVEELPPELRDTAASLGRPSEAIEPLLARLLVALEQPPRRIDRAGPRRLARARRPARSRGLLGRGPRAR